MTTVVNSGNVSSGYSSAAVVHGVAMSHSGYGRKCAAITPWFHIEHGRAIASSDDGSTSAPSETSTNSVAIITSTSIAAVVNCCGGINASEMLTMSTVCHRVAMEPGLYSPPINTV